ncbi:PKD domain-containing protein [bacterium]|nr:PKD domain-containing protein [bacterium]
MTHVTSSSDVAQIDAASTNQIELDVTPKIDVDEAKKIAFLSFKGQPSQVLNSSLVVFNVEVSPKLAWEILYAGENSTKMPSVQKIYIDASNGKFLMSWDTIYTVAATGNSYYYGAVPLEVVQNGGTYELNDPTRGNMRTFNVRNGTDPAQGPFLTGTLVTSPTNVFGDGTLANALTLAADVQYGVASTWDYYLKVHNRKGIKNDGVGSVSRVHYGSAFNNASWDDRCFCMTYGDGDGTKLGPLVALDVSAHEMTHGITSNTANLIYSGESGGLNEATSDIFGTLVEYYVNNKNDAPDYIIGEKVIIGQPGLRAMFQPELDGNSKGCWDSNLASLDVHFSSGVGNHFFYLLAEGSAPQAPLPKSPTCDNSSVIGIGRDKAAKIWYRALTVYMTSTTNYAAARVATLRASIDLFGAASIETRTVNAAWNAVSVRNLLAPVISSIPDQSTVEDVAKTAIAFRITDNDSPLSCKDSVTLKSSDPSLISSDKAVFAGTGSDCTLSLTPSANASGSAQITLTVTDGQLTAETTFNLKVDPVNDAPEIASIEDNVVIAAGGKTTIPVAVSDVDSKLDCASQVKVTSSSAAAVFPAGIVVTGNAPQCLVTFDARGSAGDKVILKIEVSDGSATSSKDVEVSLGDVAAVIVAETVAGKAPFWLKVDGSNSSSSVGKIAEWTWTFGDGTSGKARSFWKSYTKPGSYSVTLRVADASGKSHEKTLQIKVE